MIPFLVAVPLIVFASSAPQAQDTQPPLPSIDYEIARAHEIPPHRRTIPHAGVGQGFNQLHLSVTVTPTGDVSEAKAQGDVDSLRPWPEIRPEVMQWKFSPFEDNGKPIAAEVEEYIDFVPPERLPKRHVTPPELRAGSKIQIELERTGCFGSCPAYTVTLLDARIQFSGRGYVVAAGTHSAPLNPDELRRLARKFLDADFYSMNDSYQAGVTDSSTYVVSITIDGHAKHVEDYVGSSVGMPAVITALEDEVDEVAQTGRWIDGSGGLIEALRSERFNFKSADGQGILKAAASRGHADTVRELLEAGVPLNPVLAPAKREKPDFAVPVEQGWLASAAQSPEVLKVLLEAGASEKDENDKNIALAVAARAGKLEAVRALIEYGADPNADLSKQDLAESSGGMTLTGRGPGGILIYAAESGNPDVVREILRYHPNLEVRDREGKTALFALGETHYRDKEGARLECLRMLAQAGADLNARDGNGNTPLHEIYLTDLEEELLKLGADVNARNNDGETPIMTNVDNDAVALFLDHGANINLRDNKGRSVFDHAKEQGPLREEALRNALRRPQQPKPTSQPAPSSPQAP